MVTSETLKASDFLVTRGSDPAEVVVIYTGRPALFAAKDSVAVGVVIKSPTIARTNRISVEVPDSARFVAAAGGFAQVSSLDGDTGRAIGIRFPFKGPRGPDLPAPPDLPARPGRQAPRAIPGRPGVPGRKVRPDPRAFRVPWASRVSPDHREPRDQPDPRVRRDRRSPF